MPRVCTICAHPRRAEIDAALLHGEPLRAIAERTGTSATSLGRHKSDHIPTELAKAQAATNVAVASDLLTYVQELRTKAMELLTKAEQAGDYRTALAGVREARGCIELLLEVEGELDRRPSVNLVMSPAWVELRSSLMRALDPYPEARVVVGQAIAAAEVRHDA